jgi:hypothetical protein
MTILPLRVLLYIVEFIPDPTDLACYGMTSKALLKAVLDLPSWYCAGLTGGTLFCGVAMHIKTGLRLLSTRACQICQRRLDKGSHAAIFYVGSRVFMHKSCIWGAVTSASAPLVVEEEISTEDNARAYAIHCTRLKDASILQDSLFELQASLCRQRLNLLDAALAEAELPSVEELQKQYKRTFKLSSAFSVGDKRTTRNLTGIMAVDPKKEVDLAIMYVQNFLLH